MVILAVAGVIYLRSSGGLTPARVREIVRKDELIGLTLDEAASKLRHRLPPDRGDSTYQFAFDEAPGWTGGAVIVIVENGRITQAILADRPEPTEP